MDADAPGPDVASGLIDALRGEAEAVDSGAFTLDPAAALRKLRAHQLDDPHAYVLLLVEAAWLAGRGRPEGGVEVELGRTTVAEFRGLALAPDLLPNLFTAALAGPRPSEGEGEGEAVTRARVLQLLGLAANAAMALAPEAVVVESSSSAGEVTRVRLAADGAPTIEIGAERGVWAPGRIRFELHRRRGSDRRNQAERALLRERCRYTSLPVRIDGLLASVGPAGDLVDAGKPKPGAGPTRTSIGGEGAAIGVAGHTRDRAAEAGAWIVNRGVGLREPLDRFRVGVRAIVEVDLPVDLSRKQLLASPELDAIRADIRVAVERLAPPKRPAPPEPKRSFALVLVLAVFVLAVIGLAFDGIADPFRRPSPRIGAVEVRDTAPPSSPSVSPSPSPSSPSPSTTAAASDECLASRGPGTRGFDCVYAGDRHEDASQRVWLYTHGCSVHRTPVACARLVDEAEHSGDQDQLGLALVRSCLAVPGPACVRAAALLERGAYPTADEVEPRYRSGAVKLPWTSAAGLRRIGCNAGVAKACAAR